MPRIEIIPDGWNESLLKARGDGAPAIDVCADCKDQFVSGELLPLDADGQGGWLSPITQDLDFDLEDAMVGSIECAHPPYLDEEYSCACCSVILGEDDD